MVVVIINENVTIDFIVSSLQVEEKKISNKIDVNNN